LKNRFQGGISIHSPWMGCEIWAHRDGSVFAEQES
jgi:hypothetical protein